MAQDPPLIWYTGIIWFSILSFLIVLWQPFTQPETAQVLFWKMPHSFSSFYPRGAGFQTASGVILYSTSHFVLGNMYRLFVTILISYAYLTIMIPHKTAETTRARRLFIGGMVLALGYVFFTLPWFNIANPELVSIGLLALVFVIAYIGIKLPQFMLISHTSLLRGKDLFKKIYALTTEDEIEKFGMPNLVNYIQDIPEELMAQIMEIKT